MTTREEDFVEHLYVASTHSRILFLTEGGRCYSKKVHEIPQAGRASKGRHIVNLLEVGKDEKVAAIVPVESFDSQFNLIMATEKGKIKKTSLTNYEGIRRTGINAIGVGGDDRLIGAALTDSSQDVILVTKKGQAIRFSESDVRPMGRTAAGVRGITLDSDDKVVGMVVVKREGTLLVVCENGYGKRSAISDYRITHRAGKGVISIRTTERNGYVVAVKEVVDDDELMIMSQKGLLIRLSIRDIKTIGRNTQGVRLIKLSPGDEVIDVARVMIRDEEETEEAEEELEESTSVGK
jgi:DNA gyrase subunit A